MNNMKLEEVRILIADGDNALSNRMSHYLRESGFSTKIINNSYLLQKTILEWRPHFIFIDLLFPGCYAQECLKFLNQRELLGENGIHVVVMSNHNSELNVKNCLNAGADDFMVKPIKLIDILQRLSLLSQAKHYNFSQFIASNDSQVKNYFQMIQLLSQVLNQDKNSDDLRFELIQMLSMALKAVRSSIIKTNDEKNKIEVISSSDDNKLKSLPLKLEKYPEIQYILRTEKSLFIESLEKDSTMSFVKHEVKSIQFDSMMILPLHNDSKLVGSLSIRMPKDCKKLTFYDIKLAEIAAQLIAITWKFESQQASKKAA
jgi:DNA-binding response OmpR family regulator